MVTEEEGGNLKSSSFIFRLFILAFELDLYSVEDDHESYLESQQKYGQRLVTLSNTQTDQDCHYPERVNLPLSDLFPGMMFTDLVPYPFTHLYEPPTRT